MQEVRKLKIPTSEERKLKSLESKLKTPIEVYNEIDKQKTSLEDLKTFKLNQLNHLCNETIVNGFTYKIDDIVYKFSSSLEAQSNFQSTDSLFKDGLIAEVYWSATNIENGIVERITLNNKAFNDLRLALFHHINSNVSRFRDGLQPLVLTAKTNEEVDNINW